MPVSPAPVPRLPPAPRPFADDLEATLTALMPPGVPPLTLFTTLAQNPRVLRRIFAGGLLDKGSLSLRQREIVILRTTANRNCEYEWGVHVTFFAERAGLTEAEITATKQGREEDFPPADRVLIRMVDQLSAHAMIDDATWTGAAGTLEPAQLIEIIALTGFYHLISFAANSLSLPGESFAARFPA